MNLDGKLGFSLGSLLKPKQIIDFSILIDKQEKFDSIWVPESWGKEAFSTLGAISQVTKNIRLGTSIINIYSRTPATIAMGAISLDNYSSNRAIIGLGTSTNVIIENLHGIQYINPLQRMKEYIETIRLLMKSKKVTYKGQIIQIRDFKLLEKSRPNIPIFVAAVNKGMISMATKYGDGILLYLKPKDSLKAIIDEMNKDNTINNIIKALVIITSVSKKNPEKAMKRAAKTLAFYIAVGNVYYRYFLNTKYKDTVEKIYRDYHKFDIERASSNIKPDMLDDIAIYGSVNDCNYQIKKFQQIGIDLPILQINPIEDENGEFNYKEFAEL